MAALRSLALSSRAADPNRKLRLDTVVPTSILAASKFAQGLVLAHRLKAKRLGEVAGPFCFCNTICRGMELRGLPWCQRKVEMSGSMIFSKGDLRVHGIWVGSCFWFLVFVPQVLEAVGRKDLWTVA